MRVPLLIALALAAATAAGAACGDDGEPVPEPTASLSPSTPATATPSPAGTVTYSHPTDGYSFDYPAPWHLSTQARSAKWPVLYSFEPGSADWPVGRDKLQVEFTVIEGIEKSIEDWLDWIHSAPQATGSPTISSRSPAMVGGRPGFLEIFESTDFKYAGYYVALGNDRIFVVYATPANSDLWPEFEQVLASMRFTEVPTPSPTPSGLTQYLDPAGWFSFEYPSHWTAGHGIVFSYDLRFAPQTEGPPPPGHVKIDLIVEPKPDDMTIQEWIVSRSWDQSVTFLGEEPTVIAGEPALARLVSTHPNRIRQYMVGHADHIFILNAYMYDDRPNAALDALVASFRFEK